jgi:hypothetical protein
MEKVCMDEWSLVYQVRWFVWIPLSLAEELVELFMALFGLGSLGTGLAYLLGLVSLPLYRQTSTWMILLELLLSAWLAWYGLRGSWQAILALFTPGLEYQGILDKITSRQIPGSHGGYRTWELRAGDLSWEIGKAFNETLALQLEGRPVRIQYRRGTHAITRLWIGPAGDRHHPVGPAT